RARTPPPAATPARGLAGPRATAPSFVPPLVCTARLVIAPALSHGRPRANRRESSARRAGAWVQTSLKRLRNETGRHDGPTIGGGAGARRARGHHSQPELALFGRHRGQPHHRAPDRAALP